MAPVPLPLALVVSVFLRNSEIFRKEFLNVFLFVLFGRAAGVGGRSLSELALTGSVRRTRCRFQRFDSPSPVVERFLCGRDMRRCCLGRRLQCRHGSSPRLGPVAGTCASDVGFSTLPNWRQVALAFERPAVFVDGAISSVDVRSPTFSARPMSS